MDRSPRSRSVTLTALFAIGLVMPATADDNEGSSVPYSVAVEPMLGLLGCNAGSCHGKSGGQRGFALSLFGADPGSDRVAIQARVEPLDPAASLVIRKSTGQVPHAGGSRLVEGSPEYRAFLNWIGSLARVGPPRAEPKLIRLAVTPSRRVIAREEVDRIRVEATWDDGATSDVTSLCRFEVTPAGVVEALPGGLIRAGSRVGSATVLIHFGAKLATSRVIVPSGRTIPAVDPAEISFVDRLANRRLGQLGVRPGPFATDGEFARRSSLDIAGRLPDPAAVAAFEREADPSKRIRWVDGLLARPEYADHFATFWSALLRNRRSLGDVSKPATFGLHAWVRAALAANRPFDRIAADLLTAQGDLASNPAVAWYWNVPSTDDRAEDAAQVFLGMRIGCARCHRHPTERWNQDDHADFAAFFARVGTKSGSDLNSFRVFNRPIRPTDPAPRGLGATRGPVLGERDDPRVALVDWMVTSGDLSFARAAVNRYWKHFFGTGLVEPVDDLRPTNPPVDPDLLDALASDFRDHAYDLKHLVRTIAGSDTYARSSLLGASVSTAGVDLARFAPRRLPAEVLLDAIDRVAGTTTRFVGMPAGTRAVELPDDGFASPFLDAFGRPERRTACECERSAQPDLTQALALLDSSDLEAKLAAPTGRAARLASAVDPRPDAAKIDELYRLTLSRPPSAVEEARALAHLAACRDAGTGAAGFEDLIWALINSAEFLYNH